jgi:hypothetical protein
VSILIEVHPAKSFHIRNILLIFNRMSYELQKMHPRTFTNVTIDNDEAPNLIVNIGRALFRSDEITWAKIIAFLTLTSTFIVDSIKSGSHDVIQVIIDETCNVMKDECGIWIESQGGLNALCEYIKPVRSDHMSFLGLLQVLVGFCFLTHWSWIIFKLLSAQIGNLF